MIILLLIAIVLYPVSSRAQNEQDILFMENEAQSGNLLPETDDALADPLHIYIPGATDWLTAVQLGIITPQQHEQLLSHIAQMGPLLEKYELQIIPGWDWATIQRVIPFIQVSAESERKVGWKRILTMGNHQLIITSGAKAEVPDEYSKGQYAGYPFRLALRYRYRYANRFSVGFQLESDAGEPLFKLWNKQGFDFYSGHLSYAHTRMLHYAIIGDYEIRLGQGLILWNGFGMGKSVSGLQAIRSAPPLKPASSFRESGFFRGGAFHLRINNWNVISFLSINREDASIRTDTDSTDFFLTGVQLSGLHRTNNEGQRKNNLLRLVAGSSLYRESPTYKWGIQAVYTWFDKPFNPLTTGYKLYAFSGNKHWSASTDYRVFWRNFVFFGEIALANAMGFALINGVVAAIAKNTSLSIIHRFYHPRMISFYGNSWGENRAAKNEQGIYLSLNSKPFRQLSWDAYVDITHSPFSRYRKPGASYQAETGCIFIYTPKKNMSFSIRYRFNGDLNTTTNQLKRHQAVSIFSFSPALGFSLTTRLQANWIIDGETMSAGYALSQDLTYSAKRIPIEMSCRINLFQTDSYENRMYAYETALPMQFLIPAVSGSGMRYAITISSRPKPMFRLSGNWTHTLSAQSPPEDLSSAQYQLQLEWLFGKK